MNSFKRLLVMLLFLAPFSLPLRSAEAADPAKSPNAQTPPAPQDAPIVEHIRAIRRLEREVDELSQQVQAMEGRLAVLRAELNRLRASLHGLSYPLPVHGTVKSVAEDGTVLVSLGSDDTLAKGHRLAVTRAVDDKRRFIAWLEVTQTSPETATCKVVYTASKQSVEQGDQVVATNLAGLIDDVIFGVVLGVRDKSLVEISLGSDDGLEKNAILKVYRADGATYLGKIEVIDTRPDRAVCKILADTLKGVITKGDRVTNSRD